MSIKKIEQIKADKGFKIFDLIIYCLIAVIAVAFIIVNALNRGELKGVTFFYDNNEIFVYDFEEDKYTVIDADIILIEQDTKTNLTVRFHLNEDYSDFNLVEINKTERTVSVTQSDCSYRKDCVYTKEISNSLSYPIACSPHNFKIVPFDYDYTDKGTIPVG